MIEGGAKRKSPDRDDDGRKRLRPFMDITVTDQRPSIASKPKAKVEVKPVEAVSEYEPPQAQKESTLNSEGAHHFFFVCLFVCLFAFLAFSGETMNSCSKLSFCCEPQICFPDSHLPLKDGTRGAHRQQRRWTKTHRMKTAKCSKHTPTL